jgi:hypothetical protein
MGQGLQILTLLCQCITQVATDMLVASFLVIHKFHLFQSC